MENYAHFAVPSKVVFHYDMWPFCWLFMGVSSCTETTLAIWTKCVIETETEHMSMKS